jgi:hypothetical protein
MGAKSKGLNLRERTILDMAGKGHSAVDIAEKYSTSPEQIVMELDRLTKTVDWLSEAQKTKLLSHKLWKLVGDLEKAAEQSGFDPKRAEVLLKAIEAAMGQIERAQDRVGDNIERVEAAQARVFMEIIEKSLYHALGRLSKTFPELPREQIEDEFKESLLLVSMEYDAQERDEP